MGKFSIWNNFFAVSCMIIGFNNMLTAQAQTMSDSKTEAKLDICSEVFKQEIGGHLRETCLNEVMYLYNSGFRDRLNDEIISDVTTMVINGLRLKNVDLGNTLKYAFAFLNISNDVIRSKVIRGLSELLPDLSPIRLKGISGYAAAVILPSYKDKNNLRTADIIQVKGYVPSDVETFFLREDRNRVAESDYDGQKIAWEFVLASENILLIDRVLIIGTLSLFDLNYKESHEVSNFRLSPNDIYLGVRKAVAILKDTQIKSQNRKKLIHNITMCINAFDAAHNPDFASLVIDELKLIPSQYLLQRLINLQERGISKKEGKIETPLTEVTLKALEQAIIEIRVSLEEER